MPMSQCDGSDVSGEQPRHELGGGGSRESQLCSQTATRAHEGKSEIRQQEQCGQ